MLRLWGALALTLLLAFALVRITATYPELTQTIDEAEHVAAGMAWIDRGTYQAYFPGFEHPPLSRIAVALGLYLNGIRSAGLENFWDEGNAILHEGDTYSRNLALARAGILPFFVLAALVVWRWSQTLFGTPAALFATLLFTTLPPVLAHAGLATTDMPLAATVTAALYACQRWLEAPSLRRALLLGAASGLAVASKFSALLFLPAGAAALILLQVYARRLAPVPNRPGARAYASVIPALLVGLGVLWATYRFAIAPDGTPVPEFFAGIQYVFQHNRLGHLAYLLGEVRRDGWWYFFPVALVVKTPLPFLLLSGIGVALLLRRPRGAGTAGALAPALAATAILVSALPAHLNIGLRHILPIYPLLAIAAGYGASALWQSERGRRLKRGVVAFLLAAQLTGSVSAHPDYLSYFNALAGPHPERILVDSDLDWGQDLDRLAELLRYFGSADLARHGLPRWRRLQPHERVTGWVAISEFCLALGGYESPYDGYRWLDAYEPERRAGRSIRLYRVPVGSGPATPGQAVSGPARTHP